MTGKRLAQLGAVIQSGLLVGVVGTAIQMARSFNIISAQPNPQAGDLAEGMSNALILSYIGLFAYLVGFVLIIIAIWGYQYKEKWVFDNLFFSGFVLLVIYPIGTIAGFILLFSLIIRKHSYVFKRPKAPQQSNLDDK
ncbi:MotA/TolQ/ExbB proton channel family protein [Planctomycetota bacterium]